MQKYLTNEATIKLFTSRSGENGVNATKTLYVRDGKIYSYTMVIGEYVKAKSEGFEGLVIYDHTARGLGFISQTTSSHVGLLKRETTYHPRRIRALRDGLIA
jgi:hypothetical protein|tara:strand:+ start:1243 stop:1548 length:306 start_codon:yes stop_codon:yes gene_type:complete